jgi:hypothetical protein
VQTFGVHVHVPVTVALSPGQFKFVHPPVVIHLHARNVPSPTGKLSFLTSEHKSPSCLSVYVLHVALFTHLSVPVSQYWLELQQFVTVPVQGFVTVHELPSHAVVATHSPGGPDIKGGISSSQHRPLSHPHLRRESSLLVAGHLGK